MTVTCFSACNVVPNKTSIVLKTIDIAVFTLIHRRITKRRTYSMISWHLFKSHLAESITLLGSFEEHFPVRRFNRRLCGEHPVKWNYKLQNRPTLILCANFIISIWFRIKASPTYWDHTWLVWEMNRIAWTWGNLQIHSSKSCVFDYCSSCKQLQASVVW